MLVYIVEHCFVTNIIILTDDLQFTSFGRFY